MRWIDIVGPPLLVITVIAFWLGLMALVIVIFRRIK